MKKMKKRAALILGLLILAVSLAASADNTAVQLYDEMADLLFRTDNVTLTLKAEFSLDGQWFKTADITLKQSGNYGFRQMLLTSPKKDGTERHNGYTIITEGGIYHLMEVYHPGVYRDGTCGDHNTLIRRTAETEQLLSLGGVIVSQADLLLGKDAVTETEDGGIRLELGADTPALVNYALGTLARFAAQRYYDVDYDSVSADGFEAKMEDYLTIREALIWQMQDVAVKQVSATVKTGADGKISAAEGTVNVDVKTFSDGVHALGITFTAEVTDRGSTSVAPFDPKDYDVILAENAFAYTYTESPEAVDMETADKYAGVAMDIWQKAGHHGLFAVGSIDSYRQEDGGIETVLEDGNLMIRRITFDAEGIPVLMQAEPYVWMNIGSEEYNYEPQIDEAADAQARELMMNFLREVNPGLLETVKELKAACTFEVNGVLYAQYNEEPLDQNDGGVLFVVRMTPEMWIEYYTTISNG